MVVDSIAIIAFFLAALALGGLGAKRSVFRGGAARRERRAQDWF